MKYNLKAPPSKTEQNLAFDIPDLPATIIPVITGTTPIDSPPPGNQLPFVNAGQDQSITLPINQATLNGTANDTDGTITSYLWSKVSGGAANILSPGSPSTGITGLVEGIYNFRLTVTDNSGGVSVDEIKIVVNPASTGNVGVFAAIPTFECCGLYWNGHGKTSSTTCTVQFREVGTSVWNNGMDLWCDSRAIGGRPSNEYRGSLVYLKPGTNYEVKLTAGSASYTSTFQTWAEKFPETPAQSLTSSQTINTSGTSSAYKVFTGTINGGNNNLVINASYVILRGMKLTGATNDAIELGASAHDVIIEDCDISGWGQSASTLGGNNQAAVRVRGFSYNATNVKRIIIQRNKIHDPRFSASGWSTETGGDHPYGVNGINFEESGGNHVIRNNEIYGDTDPASKKRFMDGIGGADNFTTSGFPGSDSDIYGNKIRGCFDDGIEAEGGGRNVRVWDNGLNYTFTGIASATCSVGPLYIHHNISNVGMRMQNQSNSEDRGPFNKCGTNEAQFRGGRTYLFHNTVLQPSGNRGLCGGIVENGGIVNNVYSKNNIWTTAYQSQGGKDISMWQGGSCNSENDLLNSMTGNVTVINKITGSPVYTGTVGLELNPAGYFLAAGSAGKGKGVKINNFNDQDNPDIGAYNKSNLKFGI